jgi:hypothetical protein
MMTLNGNTVVTLVDGCIYESIQSSIGGTGAKVVQLWLRIWLCQCGISC